MQLYCMARKPRLEWEGASYHIMARGNARARIFEGEADHLLFVETLGESLVRFGVDLHAWVLMPNHYHLAATTPRGNLSRWMAWLQTAYTARYNRRHRRAGHLFQGRYRAEIVDADGYARHLVLYIHLNPIRRRRGRRCEFTGSLKELEVFGWSGHLDLAGRRQKPLVPLSPAWAHYWSPGKAGVAHGYRQAIQEAMGNEPEDWKDLVQRGLLAGGPELMERVLRKLSCKKDRESAAWRQPAEWERRRKKLEAALNREPDRGVACWVRTRLLGARGIDVARDLGYKDGSGVTHAVKRVERLRRTDGILARKLVGYESDSTFKG